MKLTLRQCKEAYIAIKRLALNSFQQGDDRKCLQYIDRASELACQVIWQYADSEFDTLLHGIAVRNITIRSTFTPDSERVVFFDSFGVTYILTLQYMKALVAMGKKVLYIYEKKNNEHTRLVPTLEIIKSYPGVEVAVVDYSDNIQKLQIIYDLITDFSASRIFTHINTHSAVIPVLSILPTGIIRYLINLGDHLFWLGTSFIDYSYEFRSFGATISREKRGLLPEQILLLCYYPITETTDFKGFPKDSEGKIKIFTGGDFYKIIDKKQSYWNLLRQILEQNPEVVVLFAAKLQNGLAPQILQNFIEENHFENRVLPIGFRPDINEVFAHSDIYFGTCPMSGGLMSQYAAQHSKPILQYYPPDLASNNETESVICFRESFPISFTDIDALLYEAHKLICDENYRLERGKKLQSSLITETEFNYLFAQSFENHKTPIQIKYENIQYKALTDWWIEIGNEGYFDVGGFVFQVLGKRGIFLAPCVFISYLYNRFIVSKLFSRVWYKYKIFKQY